MNGKLILKIISTVIAVLLNAVLCGLFVFARAYAEIANPPPFRDFSLVVGGILFVVMTGIAVFFTWRGQWWWGLVGSAGVFMLIVAALVTLGGII